jgi:hypothetical protein
MEIPDPGDDDGDDDNDPRKKPNRREDRKPLNNAGPGSFDMEQWAEILGRTMARGGRKPAEAPPKFENKAYQDVKVWLASMRGLL